MLYLWIAVLVAAVIIEALTADLLVIWFFPAALVSLILSLFPVPPLVQVSVFLVLGLVLIFSTRPLCRRWLRNKGEKTNADALIGRYAIVTEEINNLLEQGEVRVGGLCWSARSAGGDTIAVGEQVEILEIKGVKLIVKK